MLLTLVRHGESMGQIDAAYQGNPDPPLSPRGILQAQATGRHLADEGITQVICSPMQRAVATADAIAAACDVAQIQVWPEVREGWPGPQWGLTRAELQAQYPRAVFDDGVDESAWRVGDVDLAAYWARCEAAIDRIKTQFTPQDRVVLVAHGGSTGYLLGVLMGVDRSAPRAFALQNCSLSAVRLAPDATPEQAVNVLYPASPVTVRCIGDTGHLLSV